MTTMIPVGIIPLLVSCGDSSKTTANQTGMSAMKEKTNPVVYFEIPVTDVDRAINFYKAVFHLDFEKEVIDNNEMAFLPFPDQRSGISSALAKGDIYKPTIDGVVIYFATENIDETMKRAVQNGGQILYSKTDNGLGFVAEFKDTEGNRIALYQAEYGGIKWSARVSAAPLLIHKKSPNHLEDFHCRAVV